jgi:hypothetical protein
MINITSFSIRQGNIRSHLRQTNNHDNITLSMNQTWTQYIVYEPDMDTVYCLWTRYGHSILSMNQTWTQYIVYEPDMDTVYCLWTRHEHSILSMNQTWTQYIVYEPDMDTIYCLWTLGWNIIILSIS